MKGEKMTRRELIEQQIARKKNLISFENFDVASGNHLSCLHIGLSDEELAARGKTASTFFTKEDCEYCLHDFFDSTYGVEEVARWAADYSAANRKEFPGFAIDYEEQGKFIGKLMQNGTTQDVNGYVLILQREYPGYTNKVTGMPFDIVTLYVEE